MAAQQSDPKFACAYGFIIEDYNILAQYCVRHELKNPVPQTLVGTKRGTQRLLMTIIVPHLHNQLTLQPHEMLSTGIVEPIPTHPYPDLDKNYQIQNLLPVLRFCKWKGKNSPTTEELNLCASQNGNQSTVQRVKDLLQLPDSEEAKWYPKASYD
ncbi:hypothetical protein C8Q79DRAFT_1010232 [Trametes meyenii]|nr:hypothetical protein C8Q79DRAFT_1010232 [Trametes meyenii]